MSAMMPLFLVFAGLIAIYTFLIPGMRPKDGRFRTGRRPVKSLADIGRMGSPEAAGSWVAPLVGLLALSSLMPTHEGSGAAAGAMLGAICGLLSSRGVVTARDFGLSALGVAAGLVTTFSLLAGNTCDGSPSIMRLPVFALAMGLFLVSLVISLLRGAVPAAVGLEWFALVEIVGFLTMPLGVDLAAGSRWVAFSLAIALGLVCGLAPKPMFGLVGIGVAVVSLWASTVTSSGCALDGGPGQFVTVACGAATFLLAGGAMKLVGR